MLLAFDTCCSTSVRHTGTILQPVLYCTGSLIHSQFVGSASRLYCSRVWLLKYEKGFCSHEGEARRRGLLNIL